MFGFNWQQGRTKQWLASALAGVLVLSAVGCSDRGAAAPPPVNVQTSKPSLVQRSKQISEVSPPATIQALRQDLEGYRPQVKIVSPRADAVLEDTQVAVRFEVRDLPIFKDSDLGLGPHLHVFLDDQPYQAVYDLTEPLVLKDLSPGSHTLRVFASRPWHESFKNEGAYAQTTFHVFTATADNKVDTQAPLLTYSRPQGSYGAEPVMVDFYLTNAPLHFVAQDNPADEIQDWQVRCTVNGDSFVIDRWQPIYLKGLKPGKNWVKLELIDEKGQPIENTFNSVARVVEYQPGGSDTLSRLVRGDLTVREARGIVDPNYVPGREPDVEAPPAIAPLPTVIPSPEPEMPEAIAPEISPAPEVTPSPEALPEPPAETPAIPAPKAAPAQGLFDRFRRRPAEPVTPSPVVPAPEAAPTEPAIEPSPEPAPETAVELLPDTQANEPEAPAAEQEEPAIAPEPTPAPPSPAPTQGFWSRFRRSPVEVAPPAAEPSPVPAVPNALEAPNSPETVELEPAEAVAPSPAPEEEPEAIAPEVAKPEAAKPEVAKPEARSKGVFDFFKRSPAPAPAPAAEPEVPASLSAPESAEPSESPAEAASEEGDRALEDEPEVPAAVPTPEGDRPRPFWKRLQQPLNRSAEPKSAPRFLDQLKQAEPAEPSALPEAAPSLAAPELSAPSAPEPGEPETSEPAESESPDEPAIALPRSPFDGLLPTVLPGASTAADSANALKEGQPIRVITAPAETSVPARYRRSAEPEPEAIAPEAEVAPPDASEGEAVEE